jgi:hypothetical protein
LPSPAIVRFEQVVDCRGARVCTDGLLELSEVLPKFAKLLLELRMRVPQLLELLSAGLMAGVPAFFCDGELLRSARAGRFLEFGTVLLVSAAARAGTSRASHPAAPRSSRALRRKVFGGGNAACAGGVCTSAPDVFFISLLQYSSRCSEATRPLGL